MVANILPPPLFANHVLMIYLHYSIVVDLVQEISEQRESCRCNIFPLLLLS